MLRMLLNISLVFSVLVYFGRLLLELPFLINPQLVPFKASSQADAKAAGTSVQREHFEGAK